MSTRISDSGSQESTSSSSIGDELGWISWFCTQPGYELFCEVDKLWIEDSFNLFGLKNYFPHNDFTKMLDVILDKGGAANTISDEDVDVSILYGMIHSRYIITTQGLTSMMHKYTDREFGECPRLQCHGQAVVPYGASLDPNHNNVKLFCPKCQDVYRCKESSENIDGSAFGPTFPGVFFLTYENLVPLELPGKYENKVFGFKVHNSSKSLPDHIRTPEVDPMNVNSVPPRATSLAIVTSMSGSGTNAENEAKGEEDESSSKSSKRKAFSFGTKLESTVESTNGDNNDHAGVKKQRVPVIESV